MYESCIGYVYSIVHRYVTNESDHKDIIQDIFARVFLSVHTFDESRGSFKFWLRRLAINQCLAHYRQGKSPQYLVPLNAIAHSATDDTFSLHELSKAEIENLLSSMPDGYRQIFMLAVIDEYSHKEVSELLSISEETSRSQLSRAKSWIRKHLVTNKKQKTIANGF